MLRCLCVHLYGRICVSCSEHIGCSRLHNWKWHVLVHSKQLHAEHTCVRACIQQENGLVKHQSLNVLKVECVAQLFMDMAWPEQSLAHEHGPLRYVKQTAFDISRH